MTAAARFHSAACAVLGLDADAHGARAAVAHALGITWRSYVRSLDRCSLDTLGGWSQQLGLVMTVAPGGVSFSAAPVAELS
jgi:hypothetical protein